MIKRMQFFVQYYVTKGKTIKHNMSMHARSYNALLLSTTIILSTSTSDFNSYFTPTYM